MGLANPLNQWYPWLLAAPQIAFWIAWVFFLGYVVTDRPLKLSAIRIATLGFFMVFITSAATLSILQYQAFKSGLLSKLPAAEFSKYVTGYNELHYWRAGVTGIVVSLILGGAFLLLKKQSSGMLINEEELELSVLFGFFNPWPQTAVFFVFAFLLFMIASAGFSIIARLLKKPAEEARLVITPFLFISAILSPILTNPILLDWLHLRVIFITTT